MGESWVRDIAGARVGPGGATPRDGLQHVRHPRAADVDDRFRAHDVRAGRVTPHDQVMEEIGTIIDSTTGEDSRRELAAR